MNIEKQFETFLLISKKEFYIFVKDKLRNERIFENRLVFDRFDQDNEFKLLDKFLNENIFKIEKIIKNFVNNLVLIIDKKHDIKIGISFKNNNNGDILAKKDFYDVLKLFKNQIQENYKNWKIAHMIITKYIVDGNYYDNLPFNKKCNYFSLDVDFICFSKDYLRNIENVLNKYHIKIEHNLCANYVRNCFKNESIDLFSMSQKIIDGYNLNEIVLVPKFNKNKGFFEKFFNFFS